MANWIIPCNPNNYDVIGAFQKLSQIDWKQSVKSIEPGDVVYIYVSRPYQKIMFQCDVVKTGIDGCEIDDHIFVKDGTPFLNYKPHMRLQLIRKLEGYGLDINALKGHGLRGNIQGPRRAEGDLLGYIEKQVLIQQC